MNANVSYEFISCLKSHRRVSTCEKSARKVQLFMRFFERRFVSLMIFSNSGEFSDTDVHGYKYIRTFVKIRLQCCDRFGWNRGKKIYTCLGQQIKRASLMFFCELSSEVEIPINLFIQSMHFMNNNVVF